MATHEIPLSLVIQMQEMDGSPMDSAEILLDVYVDEIRKAIENVVGESVVHLEVLDPNSIDQPEE